MTDKLTQAAEPDQFKSESPIRAFSTWTDTGQFAVGKGFRPSIAHLTTYLDALLVKEGWMLVQIIEAEDPTMVFHRQGEVHVLCDVSGYSEGIEKALGHIRGFPKTKDVRTRKTGNDDEICIPYKGHEAEMNALFMPGDLKLAFERMSILPELLQRTIKGDIRQISFKTWPTANETHDHLLKLSRSHGKDEAVRVIESFGLGSMEGVMMCKKGTRASVVDLIDDILDHKIPFLTPGEKIEIVDHPPHYNDHPSGLECIAIKRHMPSNIGDAFKYAWRAGEKGPAQIDYEKAVWYIRDEIERRKLWSPILKLDTGSYFRQAMLIDGIGAKFIAWCSSAPNSNKLIAQKQLLWSLYIAAENPARVTGLDVAIRHANKCLGRHGVAPKKIEEDDGGL